MKETLVGTCNSSAAAVKMEIMNKIDKEVAAYNENMQKTSTCNASCVVVIAL